MNTLEFIALLIDGAIAIYLMCDISYSIGLKHGMSRYIDADKYKKDLIQLGFLPAIVTRVLDKQPTADVVAVVRCKDCEHCTTDKLWNGSPYFACVYNGLVSEVLADHYCSNGERREEPNVNNND